MARDVPANLDAEEATVGSMLHTRRATETALDALTSTDFHWPAHREVFGAVGALFAVGAPIDLLTVEHQLRQHGSSVTRQRLRELHASTPASANVAHYARLVADASAARHAIAVAEKLSAAAYASDLEEVDRIVGHLGEMMERSAVPLDVGLDIEDVAARVYDQQWLVPKLLERRDRLMISGPEGHGKSTLIRQLAVQLACGVHPFRRSQRFEPVRVVMVDCENSGSQNTRAFKYLMQRVAGRYARGTLTLVERPQGMNLRALGDGRWLDGVLAGRKPDVLCIGPLYKLFEGSAGVRKDSEEAADEVARALDRLRVKHDVAMLIEAHAPHGEAGDRAGWRPYGASLWMRWPEFGLGMKPDGSDSIRLVHWRGDRDRNRDFPTHLHQGKHWPWMADEEWEDIDPPDPQLGV